MHELAQSAKNNTSFRIEDVYPKAASYPFTLSSTHTFNSIFMFLYGYQQCWENSTY